MFYYVTLGVELPVYTSLIPQNAMEFQWCNYICGIRRLPEYRSSHHVGKTDFVSVRVGCVHLYSS